eukprot:13589.XXX_254551_253704_1 [CDS] Oithona nana genome sequencing.
MSSQQKDVDLTDEEQVQDYLDNLGIEYRFGCYQEKSPKSCQLLGEYFESITREFDKALQIFETNCAKNNHGPSCSKAGFYLASGNGGIQPDPDRGYDYLVKGCEENYGKSCLLAGMFHKTKFEHPIKTPKDLAKSTEFFGKACDLGVANGCYNHGSNLRIGLGNVHKDTEKAAKAFEKGCELDSFECCVNLSLMYKRGDGVTKDSQLAAKFQEMAHDIQKQSAERRDRITFQEGTETAGSAPLKF